MEPLKCLYGIIGNKLCTHNDCVVCYNRSFASHEKSKFFAQENEIDPRTIFKGTPKKYIFVCDNSACNYRFEAQIMNVTKLKNPTWCPHCSGYILCGDISCEKCFNKSFASHEKSKYWSKNNEEKPHEVFLNSNKKFKFDCDICKHEFKNKPSSISKKNEWCKFCGNTQLCGDVTCEICFNKSFASHEKSKYWSKNNKKQSHEVFKNSNKYYEFDCDLCLHTFSSMLNSISRGIWCGYCGGDRLCDDDACNFCYNKSFASHEKSIYWSKKNKQVPRTINKFSRQNALFDCPLCGEEYFAEIANVVHGTWCCCTKNKTETKLYKWLVHKGYIVNRQVKFDWCKNLKTNKYLPYDYLIDEYKLIIELDGRQHFMDVSNWGDVEERQNTDIYKMTNALEKGYSFIRIVQNDVWKDRNNWEQKLLNVIKSYNVPQCIYLDNDDEYTVHKKMMQNVFNTM